jgi:hypothetical protein
MLMLFVSGVYETAEVAARRVFDTNADSHRIYLKRVD